MFWEIWNVSKDATKSQPNLTCRKDHMQSPTREELWGLFRGKSDDGSTITLREYSLQQSTWRGTWYDQAIETCRSTSVGEHP